MRTTDYGTQHHLARLAVGVADAQSAISAPEPCDPAYMQAATDAARAAAQLAENIRDAHDTESPMRALWAGIASSWNATRYADTLQQMRAGSEAAAALYEVLT